MVYLIVFDCTALLVALLGFGNQPNLILLFIWWFFFRRNRVVIARERCLGSRVAAATAAVYSVQIIEFNVDKLSRLCGGASVSKLDKAYLHYQ